MQRRVLMTEVRIIRAVRDRPLEESVAFPFRWKAVSHYRSIPRVSALENVHP